MKHKLLPLSLLCTLALAACNPPQPAANASETAASSAMTSQPMAASSASMSGNATQGAGNWVSNDNQVRFTSSKTNKQNKTIDEESSFATSAAQLSADGAFSMSVDLASVKTNIDLRDERLRDWVFEVVKFPKAEISGKIDMNAIGSLKTGNSLQLKQPLTLDLHGSKQDIEAELTLKRGADNSISVATAQPVVVDAKKLGMSGGVAKLVEVMGLASINEQIPVTFNGTFTRQ